MSRGANLLQNLLERKSPLNMKLDKTALSVIAQRLRDSRKVLERTHQRIGNTLDGLQTLPELVAKATRVLNDPRNTHAFSSSRKQADNS